MKIASFDVDAQKGFTPLRPDELPVQGGDEIVEELNEQAKLADYRVGSKDCHPPKALWTADAEHPQFSPVENGGPNVDIHWNSHCVVGTKGNELLDGLPKVSEYDYFVFKGIEPDLHPYGACYHDMEEKLSTGVIEWLKSKEVKVVIVGGLAYDYCVKTTAIQLRKAGFIVVINKNATRAISPESEKDALAEMYKLRISTIDGGSASVNNWLNAMKTYAKLLGM
jgi:nicotinamidase/pyrazinamidase